jgi:hypothetical protein
MIALAMGLVPIIWTRTDDGHSFDTFDWMVAGGTVPGTTSFAEFQSILGNASTLNTGWVFPSSLLMKPSLTPSRFAVLQHDLYEITVDLAVGYTLNAALTHNPPFTVCPLPSAHLPH